MFIDKERNLLVIEKEKDTPPLKLNKKISGHSFVDILGFNPYKLPGDALLILHNLIVEEVDKKWLRRGDFAEVIVKTVYERDGHKCTIYDEEYKKANYYSCFPQFKDWGGLIDIELIDEKTLVEVKSKSLDKYESIKKHPPIDEVMQGAYYAYLRKYDKFNMEWIFFDSVTEEEVFQGKKPTTLKNLKRHSLTIDVDNDKMKNMLIECANIVEKFRKDLTIPLNLISPKYIKILEDKGHLPKTKKQEKIEMPF